MTYYKLNLECHEFNLCKLYLKFRLIEYFLKIWANKIEKNIHNILIKMELLKILNIPNLFTKNITITTENI